MKLFNRYKKTKPELIQEMTTEALLWLLNDERLYNYTKQCKRPSAIKSMWSKYKPTHTWVKTGAVDWKQVYESMKE